MKIKFNWGIGIALVYTSFAAAMILFVIVASRQNNDLVEQNYYEEAVHYQHKIDAARNSVRQHAQLKIQQRHEQQQIEISVGNTIASSGTLSFYKPDNSGKDFEIKLHTDGNGQQLISSANMARGTWKIKVSWNANGIKYYGEEKIFLR